MTGADAAVALKEYKVARKKYTVNVCCEHIMIAQPVDNYKICPS
jgi:hypothetical protein